MGQILEQGSDLATILSFLLQVLMLAIAAVAGGSITYIRARKKFQNKKEKRLFDNIQRPVALVPTAQDGLEVEARLLKAVDFFNVDLLPVDVRSLDDVTSKYRMAVVRYEDTPRFWRIFEKLADKTMPMIIYAAPGEIKTPEMIRIQKYYSRYTLCNTPVRLTSDVFAIMSVYPEDQ